MGQRLDNARALYLEAIRDGRATEAINAYAGSRYTQHSIPVRDGRQGFIEFFDDFLQRNPVRDVEIIRGFEDGRYVLLHVVQDLNHGEYRYVTADIFDTDDDGKLVEHWDIIAELTDSTQVSGPTEPADVDMTDRNKATVAAFLDGGAPDLLADTLVEHSSRATVEGTYEHVHLVIGCGDLVAALSQVHLNDAELAVIDLFRVESGRIVEHWDVIEEITPEETWVNSGKF